ncbi:MAG: acyl-CoA dehydrogenase family protein [Acidimicrobiia bacterium]
MIRGLAELGGFGLSVPEEYGGSASGDQSDALAMPGSQRCFCSSVPPCTIARVRISGRVMSEPPTPSEPHDSSSVATTMPR